jgi:hypothetical protein
MNEVCADRGSASIAGSTPLALGLIGALLVLLGTPASANVDPPREHRSAPTGSEHGPAHSDHTPRHGGLFVMAPDGWHHLEGALPRADRFHLYLYDDHTRPISATRFLQGARAWVQRHDTDGNEVGDRIEIQLRPADDGTRLEAPIPAGPSLPIEVELSLKLDPARPETVFNFNFPVPLAASIEEPRTSHKH